MIRILVRNVIRLFGLAFFQLILNMVHVTSLELSPFFYIIFVLLLPFETPQWLVLLSSFLMGILIDWPSDSFGQHTFACVLIGGIRPFVLIWILERDFYEKGTYPRLEYLGFSWAVKYALIMTFVHHFAFYMLEAFSFNQFGWVFAKTLLNTLFTCFFIIVSQYWVFKKVV